MIFAESKYLFLLLLIPVLIIIQTVVLRLRRKRLEKFGDEALVKNLMPSYSKAKVWLKLSFFLLAFFFFVLGISRPQMGAILKEHKTRGAEVMIVLDVSNSMLAEDYSPNRLERAKLAISRVVDKLRDDRIGLVVFAGNSFVQLPITTDYVSAKMFLGSISTESVPIQGTAIGDAISTALRSFSAQSDRSRAIIVITDGENHEDDPVAAAAQAAEMDVGSCCSDGCCLGTAGAATEPSPEADEPGRCQCPGAGPVAGGGTALPPAGKRTARGTGEPGAEGPVQSAQPDRGGTGAI